VLNPQDWHGDSLLRDEQLYILRNELW
jgi:hypothetical protein